MEGITLLSRCCGAAVYRDSEDLFVCSQCKRAVPPEVFISYHGGGASERRSSYPCALELKKYFADRGIPAFVCRAERKSNFKRAISEALRDANHFVLVAKDAELLSSSGWIIDDEIEKFDAYIKNSRNPGELVKKPKEAVMTAYLYGGLTREELTVYTDAFVTRDVVVEGQGGFDSIYLMISRAILATRRRIASGTDDEGFLPNVLSTKDHINNELGGKLKEIKKPTELTGSNSLYRFIPLESGGYAVRVSDVKHPPNQRLRLDIPSEYRSAPVVEIADGAFSEKAYISSVSVPSSVRRIGSYAFSGCQNLTEVTLSCGLTEISEGAFSECISLEKVEIPHTVSEIADGLFSGCVNLRDVSVPDSILRVGKEAFKGCSSLSHTVSAGGRYLGNENNPYLILAKFVGKKNYSVNPATRIIGERAFSELQLTKITIPKNVLSIGSSAFSDCARLKEISFETHELKSVCASAFRGCRRLVSVKLPRELSEAAQSAFANCPSLVEFNFYLENKSDQRKKKD